MKKIWIIPVLIAVLCSPAVYGSVSDRTHRSPNGSYAVSYQVKEGWFKKATECTVSASVNDEDAKSTTFYARTTEILNVSVNWTGEAVCEITLNRLDGTDEGSIIVTFEQDDVLFHTIYHAG